jgi:carboxyl-terminal processing protease
MVFAQRKQSRLGRCLLLLPLVCLGLAGCSAPASASVEPTTTPVTVVIVGTALSASVAPTLRASTTPVLSPIPTLLAVEPSATPAPTPLSEDMRQQIFTEVWTTINDNYLYPDFGGVDWLAVREAFAPRIAEARDDEGFYRLLGEMVGRLNDQHSRFLPPRAADKEDALTSGREEHVGIGVKVLPLHDALLIQHVFPGSPADHAGLQARDRIVAIDGALFSNGDIQGPAGSLVRLTIVRPGEASRDVIITRQLVEGRISPVVRRLEGDIAYLGITTLWVGDMDDQVQAALQAMQAERSLRGVIIDLRSNPGGWRDVLVGLLGHFVHGDVGVFVSRQGETPLIIDDTATPDLRDVPLAVLVDQGTASYAEVMAAILQHEANALVIGTTTAGNTETIYSYELTGGGRLWVAQEGFLLSDATDLEGSGLQPGLWLNVDWTRYSEANDPGIREALDMINQAIGVR